MLAKLERALEGRAELLRELADVLAAHLTIEEQIFYPTVQRRLPPGGKELVLQSYEEHAVARFALERLLGTATDDETFHAKVKALRELMCDHVDEEEDELFPVVEEHLNDEQLEALGDEIATMNVQCLRAGYKKLLFMPTAKAPSSAGPSPRAPRAGR